MDEPHEHVVRSDEYDWSEYEHDGEGGAFEFRRAQLGAQANGEQLGASITEIPPGKRAWPYHFHTGNEEAIYVLSGTARLRTPAGETDVGPGDYVALPAGDGSAHQLRNEGDEPVQYLIVSTMNDPDVTVYPDSNKVGVFAGSPPGGAKDERTISAYLDADAERDYWDGE